MEKTIYFCNDCPRECGAVRTSERGEGFCKCALSPLIARSAPHYWEEPCISGSKGSGAIFFGGCTLKCVYCQNYAISFSPKGKLCTPLELADMLKALEDSGVHNLSLITPDPYTNAIISAFEIYKPSIPVVYNCSGYEKVETLRRLDGIIDIYLPDFKYYDNNIAKKYSNAPNYRETALAAIKEMLSQTGKYKLSDNGLMLSGTMVRHLVLPGNTDNSINVLKLLDKEFKSDILLSLMHQYYPAGKACNHPEINRKITKKEYDLVLDCLFNTELDGFVQDADSAQSKYTPEFTLS